MNFNNIKHSIAILCFSVFAVNANATIQITTNTTWSTSQTINDNVEVTNNASLTISSSAVIGVAGKISIECGSKLFIDNATLKIRDYIDVKAEYANPSTTLPGAFLSIKNNSVITCLHQNDWWGGIRVWGVPNKSQSSGNMGYVYIENSTIEKAFVGIANYLDPFDPSPSPAAGGIILAKNATFKNNGHGVSIKYYTNIQGGKLKPIACTFLNCHFIVDDINRALSPDLELSNIFAHLVNVDGVRFDGCDFSNQTGFSGAIQYGIFGEYSGFIVKDYCGSGIGGYYNTSCGSYSAIQNSFKNLQSAISCHGGTGFHRVYIGHGIFDKCNSAISLLSLMKPDVVGNKITSTSSNYGIYLNACTGFRVEDNDLSISNYTGSTQNPAIGIDIVDAGVSNNDVYHNAITNYDYAIEGVGQNRSSASINVSGLKFYCNDINSNFDNSYDIVAAPIGYGTIFPQPITLTTGINKYQGVGTLNNFNAIGNYFDSKSLSLPNSNNLFNAALQFSYYYSNDNSREFPTYTNLPSSYLHTAPKSECLSRYQHILSNSYVGQNITDKLAIIKTDIDSAIASDNMGKASYLTDQYRQIVDTLLYQYMWYDTANISLDSMAMVLEKANLDYDYKIQLAMIYAALNNFTRAQATLTDIETSFSLSTEETLRINNLISIMNVRAELYNNGNIWDSLSSNSQDVVDEIANTDDYFAREQAKSIMSQFTNASYDQIYVTVVDRQDNTARLVANSLLTSIAPNPTKDNFYITTSTTSPSISIIDISGRIVMTKQMKNGQDMVDVHNLMAGIYFVKIYSEGKLIKAEKLIKE